MRKIISFSGNLQYAIQMSVHHLYLGGELEILIKPNDTYDTKKHKNVAFLADW